MMIVLSGVKTHIALGYTDMRRYAGSTVMQSQQRALGSSGGLSTG